MEFDQADSGRLEDNTPSHQKVRDGRGDQREISMAYPSAVGTEFHSFKHLRETIEERYPGLKSHPEFTKLIEDAESYLKILEMKTTNPSITPEELRSFSRELGLSRNKAEGWIHYQKLPQIYRYLGQAISLEQGSKYYERIINSLNGAVTFEDMEQKLQQFFTPN
ncbi:MAG: hypothetical protein BAJATHORv1_30437 [Candidatus Thorarchaeota archaeon]|nr:MAG: hypothetical protein BAJATHORv1_30437 [Candidatus Thorarchaeota archaeon]